MARALLVPLVGTVLAGCGSGSTDAGGSPGCRPGESVACTCADGAPGEKPCGAAACSCPTCSLAPVAGVDFGAVPPGLSSRREVLLENTGDATCQVAGLGLDGCGEELVLETTRTTASIPPGGVLSVPVAFRPTEEGPKACSLSFDVNDPTAPRRTATVEGRGEAGCLAVEPSSDGLASTIAGCSAEPLEVELANRCDVPVEVRGFELAHGGAFVLVANPPLPAAIAPGASLWFGVT